jgi:MFS family permease
MSRTRRTPLALWVAFIIVCIFYSYEFFLRIIPSLLVNVLQSQYHATAIGIASFGTSYFIGYVFMQIPAGLIFERYSFPRVASLGLLICTIGTLLFTSAHELWLGLLGRFILGCGSAFAFIGAITFIRLYFPEKSFTLLIAFVISVGTIAGAFGQVFAANIIAHLTWRYTIDGMATWGIILTIALLSIPTHYFKEAKPVQRTLSIQAELGSVLRQKKLWFNGLLGSFLYLPTSVLAAIWGIDYFTKAFGVSSELAAIAIMLLFVGWALGGPIFSIIAGKTGREKTILTLASIVMAALLFFLLTRTHLSNVNLCLILLGFGLVSSAQVLVWRIFTQIFPTKELVGTASSATNLIIMLSIAFWDLLIGQLINDLHQGTSSFVALPELHKALFILPVLVLFSPLFLLGLPRTEDK